MKCYCNHCGKKQEKKRGKCTYCSENKKIIKKIL